METNEEFKKIIQASYDKLRKYKAITKMVTNYEMKILKGTDWKKDFLRRLK
jgi:hypothetical protein